MLQMTKRGELPQVVEDEFEQLTKRLGNAEELVSGTLSADRMPAFTGEVTTTAGSVATTITPGAVTTVKLADSAVTSPKLADLAVTNAKLRQSAALSVIGRSANSLGNVADISGTEGLFLRVRSGILGFGSILYNDVPLGPFEIADMGTVTLVAGTKVVANANIGTTSRMFFQRHTAGGTVGDITYTQIDFTSFTVNSSSALDTSTLNWMIVTPH